MSIRDLPFPRTFLSSLLLPRALLSCSSELSRGLFLVLGLSLYPQFRIPVRTWAQGMSCTWPPFLWLKWEIRGSRGNAQPFLSTWCPVIVDWLSFFSSFFSLNQWFLSSGTHQLFWDLPLGNVYKVFRTWSQEVHENASFTVSHMCAVVCNLITFVMTEGWSK